MQLSLTNTTEEPEVVGDPQGSWTDALTPNTPYSMDNDLQVIVIGDKPDVREQFQQAAAVLKGTVRHLIDMIAGRRQHMQDANRPQYVSTTILNRGMYPVRVILGDGTTDQTINPGGTLACTARGYLEVRELGHAPQQGGTPD